MKFEEMQDEVKKIDNNGQGNPDVIYFQDDETTYIRLVPMQISRDDLYIEDQFIAEQFVRGFVHYKSGQIVPKTSFSPRTFGKSDPVDEFVGLELRERVSKQKFKYLMNMKPSTVYITTAVVRGKEQEGTKLLVLTEGKFKALKKAIKIAFEPDPVEDIADPKSGYDITVKVTGKDNTSTGFRDFDWNVNVRRSKPLIDSKEDVKALLTNQPDWEDAYEKLTVEQLSSYLESSLEYNESDAGENMPANQEPEEYSASGDEGSDVDEEEIINEAEKDFEKMVEEVNDDGSEEDPDDDLPF